MMIDCKELLCGINSRTENVFYYGPMYEFTDDGKFINNKAIKDLEKFYKSKNFNIFYANPMSRSYTPDEIKGLYYLLNHPVVAVNVPEEIMKELSKTIKVNLWYNAKFTPERKPDDTEDPVEQGLDEWVVV